MPKVPVTFRAVIMREGRQVKITDRQRKSKRQACADAMKIVYANDGLLRAYHADKVSILPVPARKMDTEVMNEFFRKIGDPDGR